jgi:HAD superfamily hydrolase (TIGR01509 family)
LKFQGVIFDVDGTLVDSNDAHAAEAIAERKKAIFMARYLPGVRAFPAVDRLLEKLSTRDCRLAVASSAARDELEALLEVARAKPYFPGATDADAAERSKPDPDIVLAALHKLGLAAERCVLVGDTPYDAAAARRAGVPFVGVRCGGWLDPDLQPALGVYDDPADLLANVHRYWLNR